MDSDRSVSEGRLIDLSHTVEDGLSYLSREDSRKHYAPGTEFHIGKIEMVANTGTYVDSPFHRYDNGKDLSELPLTSLADLSVVVIEGKQQSLGADLFQGQDLAGKAVLIKTGWSKHWKTDQYFEGHPFLTEAAAVFLRDAGAALVGIDSLNIDDTNDGRRPVHSILLRADIPIVEHLTNLAALPDKETRFFAVPVKVRAFGTFPVRAFAAADRT